MTLREIELIKYIIDKIEKCNLDMRVNQREIEELKEKYQNKEQDKLYTEDYGILYGQGLRLETVNSLYKMDLKNILEYGKY